MAAKKPKRTGKAGVRLHAAEAVLSYGEEPALTGVMFKLRPRQHAALRRAAFERAAAARSQGRKEREDASAIVRWLLDEWEKKGFPTPPLDWEG